MDLNELLKHAFDAYDLTLAAEALHQGAHPNYDEDVPSSALSAAAWMGQVEMVRLLLENGARVAAEQGRDSTSLHTAAETGNIEIAKMLLAAGGEPALHWFDYLDRTPLICAVYEHHLDMARFLIRAGSDVNARNEAHSGDTALHQAVRHGSLEMVKLLLGAGADPMARGWMWVTPLHIGKRGKSPERKVIHELLQKAFNNPARVREKGLSTRKAKRGKAGAGIRYKQMASD